MQIRQKLTYQFIVVVAVLLLTASLAIYFFSADYRLDLFYSRLKNKAISTAKLLIEVDEVDIALLTRIEKDNPTSLPQEKINIYDSRNELLYSSDEDGRLRVTQTLLDQIRAEKEIRYEQDEFEILGFEFVDPDEQFVVVAGAVDIYGFNRLKNLRTILLIVFGVSIGLASVSGWIYAGRALKPISRVINEVDDITISSLNLRLHEGESKDEIAKLAATFNSMLDRLETAFIMQKNFIANASHELRTPLTTITGQLEVALMNERTAQEYKLIMSSVLDDIKNLNTVSNRLLLLAQASSSASNAAFHQLRLDDIIWLSKTELSKRNPEYQIQVVLDNSMDEEAHMTINGNEQLMKTAVTNLMDNGCKYSSTHQINVLLYRKDNRLKVDFLDTGIGIAEEDLKHIFEPFYRGKNVSTIKGHGIGLSLVERIVQLHQGEIHVTSRPGKGTLVTISFPLSYS
jgi:signal transduction histidine kinase